MQRYFGFESMLNLASARLISLGFRERGNDIQIRYQNVCSFVDDKSLVLQPRERACHHFPHRTDPGGELVMSKAEFYLRPVVRLDAVIPCFLKQKASESLTNLAKRERFDELRAPAKARRK